MVDRSIAPSPASLPPAPCWADRHATAMAGGQRQTRTHDSQCSCSYALKPEGHTRNSSGAAPDNVIRVHAVRGACHDSLCSESLCAEQRRRGGSCSCRSHAILKLLISRTRTPLTFVSRLYIVACTCTQTQTVFEAASRSVRI